MSVTLAQTLTAVGINLTSSFGASGGTAPYVYTLRPNGAGGTINSSTGLYAAPAVLPVAAVNSITGTYLAPNFYDTIVATDATGLTATAQILVGDALLLFCDIIQTELSLPLGRVYLWDQKLFQPTDNGLYVAVSVISCRPFGNTTSYTSGTGLSSVQSVNMFAQLQVDIISRDSSARTQKEFVLMALMSDYAQRQQQANSFLIGRLPPGSQFNNLSSPDGAAIPYRFTIAVGIQYFVTNTQATNYMVPSASPTVNYSQS